MAGLKRATNEFEEIGNVSHVKAAKVHGRVMRMSPMKASSNGKSYFVGEIADKTGTLAIVVHQILLHYKVFEKMCEID